MRLVRWLTAQPWGQVMCFTFAALCMNWALSGSHYDDRDGVQSALHIKAAIVLFAAGFAFRTLAVWRDRGRR